MTQNIPTLYTHPFTTSYLFTTIIFRDTKYLIQKHKSSFSIALTTLSIYILIHFIANEWCQSCIEQMDRVLTFVAFWIGLGVLSSIGLGTGLHTFILYLGPKVAKFVMASYECGYVVQMRPSRYSLDPVFHCAKTGAPVTFCNLFLNIWLEGFLWGLGTAIGELPPYIVSKTAAIRGKRLEMEGEKKWYSIARDRIFDYIQRNSFMTILLLASIPNPLFDLAGLTCGYLQINFWTFFSATAIGKSMVKVNIQLATIIFSFSRQTLD